MPCSDMQELILGLRSQQPVQMLAKLAPLPEIQSLDQMGMATPHPGHGCQWLCFAFLKHHGGVKQRGRGGPCQLESPPKGLGNLGSAHLSFPSTDPRYGPGEFLAPAVFRGRPSLRHLLENHCKELGGDLSANWDVWPGHTKEEGISWCKIQEFFQKYASVEKQKYWLKSIC